MTKSVAPESKIEETSFSHSSETYQLNDGSYINCEILDTGGQERYRALNRIYYKRAECCLLVYDITNRQSFEECQKFYKNEIKNYCNEDIKVILIGNKTDLEEQRVVSKKEGADFAEKNGYYFRETSCMTLINVSDAFETIILMTNNDMIKKGTQIYEQKMDLDKLKKKNEKQQKNQKNCC